MPNRLGDARLALFGVLEPVLPGRVASAPPTSGPYPAPYIWIEQPDVSIGFTGTATKLTVASFPVWIGYDGAVRAQVAGLDDLVSQVWDAVQQVRQAMPQSATSSTIDGGPVTVRAVVVSVDVTIAAMTLCVPTAAPSPIPPVPVLASR